MIFAFGFNSQSSALRALTYFFSPPFSVPRAGLLPDEDWQRFVDAITSLNKEGKDIELDAYKVKSGEKYKTTIFQQANHYTQYLNAPAPRFSFVAWTWPHRDAFRRAAAAGRLGEQTEGHPPVGVQLLVRRAASVIQRVPEFQKQQPAVNELKAFSAFSFADVLGFAVLLFRVFVDFSILVSCAALLL